MLSQILILSCRGTDLLYREYTDDGIPLLANVFRSHLKKGNSEELLPVIKIGNNFIVHIKCNGLYFICTASPDEPPFAALELLERICSLVKDFCGMVCEEAVIQNTALVYELLDEVIDYGIIQTTSTRSVKPYIQREPVAVKPDRQIEGILGLGPGLFGSDFQLAPSNCPDKPLSLGQHTKALGGQKNEIFVDVIERLTVLMTANGSVIQSELNGSVQLRSFLIGNPELVIGVSEDLVIGRGSPVSSGPGVRLDHVQFHPTISLSEFEQKRVLTIQPQEGETTIMKYGMSSQLPSVLPFRVSAVSTKHVEKQVVDVELALMCNMDPKNHAVNITAILPLPKATTDVAPSLQSQTQTVEHKKADKTAVWTIKKMTGGMQYIAKLRIHVEQLSSSTLMELGPVSLEFEIKDYAASQLAIRYLKVFDRHNAYVPFRWVRYATLSDSYVVRLR
ncbi:AP-4 complex subunit mu-1-like [Diadema antillarum]|uniref:AP-4 complex subunit mu-1-like n=1 Tax=Diadema antillarum TaxID=105358 RepID=UPI003A8834B4